jgi:hypothetical protein
MNSGPSGQVTIGPPERIICGMPNRHAARRRWAVLAAVALAVVAGSIGVANARTVTVNGRGGCPILPASNVWNKPVNTLPKRTDSLTLMTTMSLTKGVHPDFGTFAGYGIPINNVTAATPRKAVSFEWPAESDAGPYPIPASPKIEGAGDPGDRHILMIDTSTCKLWELYLAIKSGGNWTAGSGAIYDLKSNALRPDGWTSADAAGLPIYPGLARYDEVAAGVINHALRFTVPQTRNTHIYPARHDASDLTATKYPPMGLRLRLKSTVSISGYSAQSRVILTALKKYGMILADNGSAYYISGAPDPRWDDDGLHDLGGIKGSDFEAVDTTGFVNGP